MDLYHFNEYKFIYHLVKDVGILYECTQYRSISSNNEQNSTYRSQQHAIIFMKYYSSSNKCTQYRSISLNNEQ